MDPTYFGSTKIRTSTRRRASRSLRPVKLKWFRNQKFRQAMAHAIDRPSIIQSVYAGRAKPNYGFLSPANKRWFNPNTPEYPYSHEKSKALLAEIGIQDRNGDGILEDADRKQNRIHPHHQRRQHDSRKDRCVPSGRSEKSSASSSIFSGWISTLVVDRMNVTYDYEAAMLLVLGGSSIDPAAKHERPTVQRLHARVVSAPKIPSTDWEARMDELMIGN